MRIVKKLINASDVIDDVFDDSPDGELIVRQHFDCLVFRIGRNEQDTTRFDPYTLKRKVSIL